MNVASILLGPEAEAVAVCAIVFAGDGDTSVIAVAGGFPGADAALLGALTRGAHRAILLDRLDPKSLADLLREIGPAVAIFGGDSASELAAEQVSAYTGWTLVYGVRELAVVGTAIRAELDGVGERFTVQSAKPLIACLHRDAPAPAILSLPEILAGRPLVAKIERVSAGVANEPSPPRSPHLPVVMCDTVEQFVAAVLQSVAETAARYRPAHGDIVVAATPLCDLPTLTSARVVVAGGRGLGRREAFDSTIRPLASALGGAPAASGGAVVAGLADVSLLVGQTGAQIAPDVYIALGISGADQHTGGVGERAAIFAVSEDPAASIFRVARYGFVGDAADVARRLLDAVSSS